MEKQESLIVEKEDSQQNQFKVPADIELMKATWLGWPYHQIVVEPWCSNCTDYKSFQNQIVTLIKTITKYQEVLLLCIDQERVEEAKHKIGPTTFPVYFIDSVPYYDVWTRDEGPIFRTNTKGEIDSIGLGFTGWGYRSPNYPMDAELADRMAHALKISCNQSPLLHGEGGATVTDGDGTIITSQAPWVNDNRNPGMTRDQIEKEIKRIYGGEKVIWCKGARDADITDGHIDTKVRFIKPGHILVTVPPQNFDDQISNDSRDMLTILQNSVDAKGRKFEITLIQEPTVSRLKEYPPLVNSYLNFLLVNGGLITCNFGDQKYDEECRQKLQKAYPDRVIEMLELDYLYCRTGGGIHCLTQELPASNLNFDDILSKYTKSQKLKK